jgi:alpha-tubulin suppressor-like RCC1 family protein
MYKRRSLLPALLALGMMVACDDPFAPEDQRVYMDVATGAEHTCAITTGGDAYCWGRNSDGQLGDGTRADRFEPTKVADNLRFKSITAGDAHTCALTDEGKAYCWGWSAFYQLGNPLAPTNTEPVPVTTEVRFSAISAGAHHTCAIALDTKVYCWGYNRWGQGGLGLTEVISTPLPVAGDFRAIAISAGGDHTCAISPAQRAFCWGKNESGELGAGSDQAMRSVPAQVAGALLFTSIDAGRTHTCAISTLKEAYCWGSATYGELGDGGIWRPDLAGPTRPIAVTQLLDVAGISAGTHHTCATDATGLSWCWGRGEFGQLANGDIRDHAVRQPVYFLPTRRQTNDLLQFTKLATGGLTHACGLAEGSVWCWGTGPRGQLGLEEDFMVVTLPQRVE